LGLTALLSGCIGNGVDDESVGPGEFAHTTSALTPGMNYLSSPWKRVAAQSDGGSTVEKFASCGVNEFLSGFGARVSNGDVTGLLIYCDQLLQDGTVGTRRSQTTGGTPIEATIEAAPGYGIVAVGGRVDGSKFTFVSITECAMRAEGMVDPNSCFDVKSYVSGRNGNDPELTQSIWAASIDPSIVKERLVMTGVGLTAGFEALKTIRVEAGYLAKRLLNETYSRTPADVQQRWAFSSGTGVHYVPNWASVFDARLGGGTGDADLYMQTYWTATTTSYACRSWGATNDEACQIVPAPGSNYSILIDAYRAYSNVELALSAY
jgi:hypothetical protein